MFKSTKQMKSSTTELYCFQKKENAETTKSEKANLEVMQKASVVKLIYKTDPEIMSWIFGSDEKSACKTIEKAFDLKESFFSHSYTYGVVNEQNQLTGLLIGYTGEEASRFRLSPFFKALGVFRTLRLLVTGPLMLLPLTTLDIPTNSFYVSNLSIDPQYRGKGFGKYMLNKGVEIAKKKRCQTVILDVSIHNKPAIALYQKIGFSITKTKKIWFSNHGTYTMVLPLQ